MVAAGSVSLRGRGASFIGRTRALRTGYPECFRHWSVARCAGRNADKARDHRRRCVARLRHPNSQRGPSPAGHSVRPCAAGRLVLASAWVATAGPQDSGIQAPGLQVAVVRAAIAPTAVTSSGVAGVAGPDGFSTRQRSPGQGALPVFVSAATGWPARTRMRVSAGTVTVRVPAALEETAGAQDAKATGRTWVGAAAAVLGIDEATADPPASAQPRAVASRRAGNRRIGRRSDTAGRACSDRSGGPRMRAAG
jgi:hypothetical protein